MGRIRDFQKGVGTWLENCFGFKIANDKLEQADRFLEEALEVVQTTDGFTQERAHQLVGYVFTRPVGALRQEVGGAAVTLAALCVANNISLEDESFYELGRIEMKMEAIRAKHAQKAHGSALAMPGNLNVLSMLAMSVAKAQEVFRWYGDLHAAKPDMEKAERNYALADMMRDSLGEPLPPFPLVWAALLKSQASTICSALHFIDTAAGEGLELDGIDAASLYISLAWAFNMTPEDLSAFVARERPHVD